MADVNKKRPLHKAIKTYANHKEPDLESIFEDFIEHQDVIITEARLISACFKDEH